MDALLSLYRQWQGADVAHIEPLPKAGSNRQYYRLTAADGQHYIGAIGTNHAENHSFLYLARHFAAKGLPVPTILAVSPDEGCYIQTDGGTTSLYDVLRSGRESSHYSPEDEVLLERTIRHLAHLQVEGANGIDFSELMQPNVFDRQSVFFDLHYFKYCFLRPVDVPYDEVALEADFEHFAADLVAAGDGTTTFLYRDFQARNVLVDGDRLTFIDFQGGRRGPLHYDVASFLWQASAHYPDDLRERLIRAYLSELATLRPDTDPTVFRHTLRRFVLFRTLQVLGAYGLRGLTERKSYFLRSIPHAIANLSALLSEGVADDYPVLRAVLQRLTTLPRFQQHEASTSRHEGSGSLTVRICSFSYKRGIPQDPSGNGGGYVFDCRSTHNPGRYAPYKALTGLDKPVIDFLEDDGEILTFLESVHRLADAHVERYLQRGFTSLMFCFGCTGGQHRSVYSAQHLAEHLHQRYGVRVVLQHREQGIERILQ